MFSRIAWWSAFAALVLLTGPALSQEVAPPPKPAAAVVNGEPIPEQALARALKPVPPEHQARARQEILAFLIDTTLLDQHLTKMKLDAPKEELDNRLGLLKQEVAKQKQEFAKVLEQLMLTEDELKKQIAGELRWENYVKKEAPDATLQKFFAENRDWFDASQVRARHILISVDAKADAKTRADAQAKLAGIKKELEAATAKAAQTIDPKADATARQQALLKAIGDAFGEAAKKHSDCPSKDAKSGAGDLSYFPRVGAMVEPFAKTAFALQPGQMSDIVETQFGYHLILVTARMPGRDVKFDDLKEEVREVYAERLREQLMPELRKLAKIEYPQPVKQ